MTAITAPIMPPMPPRLILASTSPRRRELLGRLGLPFEVVASRFEEERVSPEGLTPPEYVITLARGKAGEVAARAEGDAMEGDALVIGADTTVVRNGHFLNKPSDAEDACRMLRRLSGRAHQVYTGVCLIRGGRVLTDYAVTEVTFDTLSEETIAAYVATGEPLDKAGAYGIQGKALSFIPSIHGDYFNVVGLPLFLLCQMLPQFGVSIW